MGCGISGDTGCKITANELLDYGFNQLWTVVVKFKSLGKGKYETKIVSAHHVSGPQSSGDTSTLQGQQVKVKNENCAEGTIDPDVGRTPAIRCGRSRTCASSTSSRWPGSSSSSE